VYLLNSLPPADSYSDMAMSEWHVCVKCEVAAVLIHVPCTRRYILKIKIFIKLAARRVPHLKLKHYMLTHLRL
jgi:hypothetical protein